MLPLKHHAPVLSLAALLMTGGCVYDYAGGYAPSYPAGYDNGMGSGQYVQPGDQFGGRNVASIDVFYGPLAQYGRWTDSRFGRSFVPNAAPGWRPYVNGRWGEDRLWLSNDPWGWATDHYGRWGFDDRIGWVWIPDTQWAPSWVAWRDDEDQGVAGWAPIPPGIGYAAGVGFGSSWGYDNWNSWYAPSWVWVPRNYLYQPGFGGHVLPWSTGYNYWRGSHWNHQGGYRHGNYGQQGDRRPAYGQPRPDGQYQGRPNGRYQARPDGDYNGGEHQDGRRPRNTNAGAGDMTNGAMATQQSQPSRSGRASSGYAPPTNSGYAPPTNSGYVPGASRGYAPPATVANAAPVATPRYERPASVERQPPPQPAVPPARSAGFERNESNERPQ